jgi:hypothetical protein
LAALALAAACASAQAAPVLSGPDLSATVDIYNGDAPVVNWSMASTTPIDNGDGTFTYLGSNNPASTVWTFSWDVDVDPDPFINSTLTFVNETASTLTFNVLLSLPVNPGFTDGYKDGTLSWTFQDYNGAGAADGYVALTNFDWNGRINGANAFALTTFDGSCGPGSIGCTGSVGPVSDGPLFHAGNVNSIAVAMSFDLSSGDRAVISSYFNVVPVPLPAAVWLFVGGMAGLFGFARRFR